MKMAVSKISGRPEEYFLKRGNRVFLASEIIFKKCLEIIWANLITFSCSLGEEVQKLRFSEIWCELINYATNRKSYKIWKKAIFGEQFGKALPLLHQNSDWILQRHIWWFINTKQTFGISNRYLLFFFAICLEKPFDLIRIKISLRIWPKTKGRFYTKTCIAMSFWARNTIITKTFENQEILKS